MCLSPLQYVSLLYFQEKKKKLGKIIGYRQSRIHLLITELDTKLFQTSIGSKTCSVFTGKICCRCSSKGPLECFHMICGDINGLSLCIVVYYGTMANFLPEISCKELCWDQCCTETEVIALVL